MCLGAKLIWDLKVKTLSGDQSRSAHMHFIVDKYFQVYVSVLEKEQDVSNVL